MATPKDVGNTLPYPVRRMLKALGKDMVIARKARRLSQEELAQRIDASVSTVRRMEDGYPGTALHTFLRALHVLGRLEAMTGLLALENDALGLGLVQEQLPQRVRSKRPVIPGRVQATPDDELEGF